MRFVLLLLINVNDGEISRTVCGDGRRRFAVFVVEGGVAMYSAGELPLRIDTTDGVVERQVGLFGEVLVVFMI